jgi:hypothetical protein
MMALIEGTYGRGATRKTSNFEIGISVAATLESTPPHRIWAGGLGIKVNPHC